MNKLLYILLLLCMSATLAMAQVNLTNGLVAYYPFNGSFNDASGTGNHGTGMNGVTFGTDQWGNANNAAYFDGVDDWISVAPSASITPGHQLSIALRFKTTSSALQLLLSKSNYSGSNAPHNLQYQVAFNAGSVLPNNGLLFSTNHTNACMTTIGFATSYSYGTAVNNNQWYCVVITFNNGVKKIYMNGSLISTLTVSGTANNTSIDSCGGGTLRMGVWWQNDLRYFSGLMDEVRLWNRTLNAQEIDSVCHLITPGPCAITPAFTDSVISCLTYKMINGTTGSGSGGFSYNWDFGGGNTSTSKDPVFTFPGYGNHTVKLTVSDGAGCTESITKNINIPYVHFARGSGDTITCNGKPVYLSASGGNKYSWSPTTSLGSPTAAFTKASPATTTQYIVTVTDNRGCEDWDTVMVIVQPPPVPVRATTADTMICAGDKLRLNATGAIYYQWMPLEGLDNPNIAAPLATIKSDVQFVVSGRDAQGCVSTDTVMIKVAPGPDVEASSEGVASFCRRTSLTLKATGNAVSYKWWPPNYLANSNSATTTASPPATTVYTVTGTGVNGCTTTDTVTAHVQDGPGVFMPDAFTPNGDGRNDEIRPVIYCDFTLDEYRIYNRWGQVVFTANDVSKSWKGYLGASAADAGVYHYVIIGKRPSKSETATYKGNFLLIR